MSFRLEHTSIESLMQASDYRSFILTLIQERKKQKHFGYSDIARIGGFSARSFPREVAIGKKHLTLTSLPKMIRGLRISSDLSDYFKLLVEIDVPDCRPKIVEETKLLQMKENLKKRILSRRYIQIENSDKAFMLSCIPRVYAALGDLKNGSDLKQIIDKTSLSENEILEALKCMLDNQIVEKKGRKFFAKEMHANFQNLKSEIFKKHFIKTAETSIQMSKQFIESDEKLFLSSAFSVSRHDLPKLKEELRSLLLKYVDSAENARGNKVVSLLASLY
jgi:uncharacterized protein (TIGR02147 family)